MLEAEHWNTKDTKYPRKSRALFAFFAPFRAVRGPIPFAVVASSLMLEAKHWNTKATKPAKVASSFRVFRSLSRSSWSNPFRSGCFISYAGGKALEHESHETPRKSRALFALLRSLSRCSWSNPFRGVRGPIPFAVVASSLTLDAKHRNTKATKYRESRELFSRFSLPFAQFVVQSLAQWLLHLLCSTQSIGTRKPRNTAKVASSFRVFAPFRAVRGPIPFAQFVVQSLSQWLLHLSCSTQSIGTRNTAKRRELFSRTSLPFAQFVIQSLSRFSWSNPLRAVRCPTSLLINLLRYYRRIIFWVKAILVRNC